MYKIDKIRGRELKCLFKKKKKKPNELKELKVTI